MSWSDGDLVFFFHPKHSWVVGNIVSSAKGLYTCKADDAVRKVSGDTVDKVKEDMISQCREDLMDENVNDLLSLTLLHDATLLRCLYVRYMKDIIYTNIGAIVVAFNPFNFKIPHYMDDKMPLYLAEGERIEVNLPHSWAQAHNTYHEMIADSGNQCVLISGESGAGKTEATKIVMKYLANIAFKHGTDEQKQAGVEVGIRLSSCSPILESFGNAKTVRNDNSSRFGKFMRVKFNPAGQLVGAHTTKYLLEKSRILTASPGERVYHAFYLVARGSDKGPFGLIADDKYKSLNAGKTLHNKEFDTGEEYDAVKKAMLGIGMAESEIHSVWSCTAAILSLPNLEFKVADDASAIDDGTESFLNTALSLLKVDAESIKKEFVTTTLEINKSFTTKKLSVVAANDGRDALCKALYDGMFSWLVEKCNSTCDVPDTGGNWIGLLDIFGFEDFELNSFEQICINLANETLQNHYNTYIFSKDMEECRSEGIDVTEVKCPDNSPCLNLVSAKGGIMAILDEECSLGQGSDLGFLDKIVDKHSKNPFFEKKKVAKSSFIVKHYAGNVSYEVDGWLEKNRDTLKDAMKIILRESTDPLIATFLPEPIPQDQKKGKALTVGGFFKQQVGALMDVINSTNPHWIRCIKPHPAKKPLLLDGITTMGQLESSGVLGTVKIRKAGYPIRIPFEKFVQRYSIITPNQSPDPRTLASNILTSAELSDPAVAQVGATKVFLKSESYPALERKRNNCFLVYSVTLQKAARSYHERVALADVYWKTKYENAASTIQSEYREYLGRSQAIRAERARLRAEMEAQHTVERSNLETEEQNVRNNMFVEDYEQIVQTAYLELQSALEEIRKLYAMWREDRVKLEALERWVRNDVAAEFERDLGSYRAPMMAERLELVDSEMSFTDSREQVVRSDIERQEALDLERVAFFERRARTDVALLEVNGEYADCMEHDQLFEAFYRRELEGRYRISKSSREIFERYTASMAPYISDIKDQIRQRQKRLQRREAKLNALRALKAEEEFKIKRNEEAFAHHADRVRIAWEQEMEAEALRDRISRECHRAMKDDVWRQHQQRLHRAQMQHDDHYHRVRERLLLTKTSPKPPER